MTRWLQRLRHALLFSLLMTGAAAWAAPLTLASKNFTEQRILSAITVQYLRAKGFQVEPKTNSGHGDHPQRDDQQADRHDLGIHRHLADHL